MKEQRGAVDPFFCPTPRAEKRSLSRLPTENGEKSFSQSPSDSILSQSGGVRDFLPEFTSYRPPRSDSSRPTGFPFFTARPYLGTTYRLHPRDDMVGQRLADIAFDAFHRI
ncbi:MAG: hypothetical protein R3231_11105 [bacterium]|nr:hypothetical protein [bacterium]